MVHNSWLWRWLGVGISWLLLIDTIYWFISLITEMGLCCISPCCQKPGGVQLFWQVFHNAYHWLVRGAMTRHRRFLVVASQSGFMPTRTTMPPTGIGGRNHAKITTSQLAMRRPATLSQCWHPSPRSRSHTQHRADVGSRSQAAQSAT